MFEHHCIVKRKFVSMRLGLLLIGTAYSFKCDLRKSVDDISGDHLPDRRYPPSSSNLIECEEITASASPNGPRWVAERYDHVRRVHKKFISHKALRVHSILFPYTSELDFESGSFEGSGEYIAGFMAPIFYPNSEGLIKDLNVHLMHKSLAISEWTRVENLISDIVASSTLFVLSGPLWMYEDSTVEESTVPSHFFKIVTGDDFHGVFIFPNESFPGMFSLKRFLYEYKRFPEFTSNADLIMKKTGFNIAPYLQGASMESLIPDQWQWYDAVAAGRKLGTRASQIQTLAELQEAVHISMEHNLYASARRGFQERFYELKRGRSKTYINFLEAAGLLSLHIDQSSKKMIDGHEGKRFHPTGFFQVSSVSPDAHTQDLRFGSFTDDEDD